MKKLLASIRDTLLWKYERGSWQYDLLCLLIIAAIFLIPGSYFGDRDRTPPREAGEPEVVWAEDLHAFLERRNNKSEIKSYSETMNYAEVIALYLHDRHKREVAIVRTPEVFSDAAGRTGYRVWYRVK